MTAARRERLGKYHQYAAQEIGLEKSTRPCLFKYLNEHSRKLQPTADDRASIVGEIASAHTIARSNDVDRLRSALDAAAVGGLRRGLYSILKDALFDTTQRSDGIILLCIVEDHLDDDRLEDGLGEERMLTACLAELGTEPVEFDAESRSAKQEIMIRCHSIF